MTLSYNIRNTHQDWEDIKQLSMLSDTVGNDNKLRHLHKNAVKQAVAPRQYYKAKLWKRIMEMNKVAIALYTMKRKWPTFHCRECMYATPKMID